MIAVPVSTYALYEPADFTAQNIESLREKGFVGTAFTCEGRAMPMILLFSPPRVNPLPASLKM